MYKNGVVPVSFGAERDLDAAIAAQKRVSDEGSITFRHVIQITPMYAADSIPAQAIT